mmetsp:Transcript_26148/g.61662  ORF Transcript_26148/g.61662 Transcript_26148/m.61662 type:complete len:97 (-) Transcript_26148:1038-1328(-)
MELGAIVCLPPPAQPLCGECPLASVCLGRTDPMRFPPKPPKTKVREELCAVCIVSCKSDGGAESFLVEKRSDTGLLAGMWQFPCTTIDDKDKVIRR